MTTPVDVEMAVESGTSGLTSQTTSEMPPELGWNARTVFLRLTVDRPVGAVWRTLVSAEGTALWLGEGAVLGDKGQSYHCADGSAGVVRSFHPLEQLRLTWSADPEAEPSLIEVDVTPEGSGTRLRLWHDGLPTETLPAMREHWQQRLTALAALA